MILNIIKGFINQWYYDRFIIYVIPFIIVLFFYFFVKTSLQYDPYIFFICSILCILAGNWGNLSGTVFLIFSLYAIKYKGMILLLFAILILTIILKFVFLMRDGSILDVIQYCIGFEFVLLIYFNMMHPKRNFVLQEDKINIQILDYLIQGYKIKEIAVRLNLTYNAVAKRLEKMRIKYSCSNNTQMICSFMKTGQLRLK
jgi:hypothetical protein